MDIRPVGAVCLDLLLPVVNNTAVACRAAVAALALAGASVPAHAEQALDKPLPLSAAEFLGKVEKSNPRFEMIEGDVAAEEAAVTAAGLWANPSLAYDREEIPSEGQNFPENIIRLELPLEISGRRRLKVQGAELGARAARQTAVRAKKDVLLDALGVYLRAASARLRLDALMQERAALSRLVVAMKSRTAAGESSGYDLDRVGLEADTLDDLVLDAGREITTYRGALGLLAGAPESRFDAGDELALPALPIDAANGALLAARPDYQAAGLRVAQAEKELTAAGRGWVPGLSLSGGTKSAVPERDTRWGYVAGITFTLPFLDFGQADAARARARLLTARAEQRLIEQQVLIQVNTSNDNLVRTVEQDRRFEDTQVPRLDRLVRRAEISYREGERPIFELLDAYRTARGIRLRATELRLQARLAELELWRARGLGPGGNP